MKSLQGCVVAVTGGSAGIGEATAVALAGKGARVALIARREDRLRQVAETIRAQGGVAETFPADVSNEVDVRGAFDLVRARFGRLDILVTAAGYGVAASFSDTLASEYRPMIDINYLGVLHCLAAALPDIKRSDGGHLVLVSSGAGRFVNPSAVYSGTKHAVSALAESLRRELTSSRVRVSVMEPGAVRSEFISRMRPEIRRTVEARLKDIEMLEPSDVADAIVYAVTAPQRVNISILTLYPNGQA